MVEKQEWVNLPVKIVALNRDIKITDLRKLKKLSDVF